MLSSSEDPACKTYSYPRTITALSKLHSEDGFRTGCRNVSHKQQSFSGLQSPRWPFPIKVCYSRPGFKPFSYKLDKLKRLKTGTWCGLVYLVKWRWLMRLRTLITGMVLFRRKRHSNSWPWFLKLRSMPCLCPYKKKEWVEMRSIPRLTPI